MLWTEGEMEMLTKIAVCLEVGQDGTGAFAPSCPGCWVFGRTPERALLKAKAAVSDWFEWLKQHEETASVGAWDIEVEVSEMMRVDYNPVDAGKPEPIFWSEVAPITKKDIGRTLRLMGYSRQDLLKIVSDLSSDCLDWLPPNEPRTIGNCLRHVACVEPWYMTRLNVDLPCKYPRQVFTLLDLTRNVVVDCLKSFPREKMRGIFQPAKDANEVCNLWSARKVLRRLVDHERLHARYIERVLRLYKEAH
jgi:predicted RNase H-like HicB family nuclease